MKGEGEERGKRGERGRGRGEREERGDKDKQSEWEFNKICRIHNLEITCKQKGTHQI